MKKIGISVEDKNGEVYTFSVWVEDDTFRILEGQSEEFVKEYILLRHKESLIERKETRRHQSLDKSMENGFEIKDLSVNIEQDILQKERNEKLHEVIKKLDNRQKWLVEQVFFYDVSITTIAEKEGVSRQAIQNRLKKIYEKMKKYLI